MIAHWLEKIWYQQHSAHWARWVLWPLSLIYGMIQRLHKTLSTTKNCSEIPVIVVGNITVGGTGKTPLVIAIVEALGNAGYKVGIVSRGYRAKTRTFPHSVQPDDAAILVGDEPLLLRRRTGVPVVIAPKRNVAVAYLRAHYDIDVVVSDDGLQHYPLARTVEIAVIDGKRRFGNGMLLPAGPLRERQQRLSVTDFLVVANGKVNEGEFLLQLEPGAIRRVCNDEIVTDLPTNLIAIAGIGNPASFQQTLKYLAINCEFKAFSDHYQYTAADFKTDEAVLMTEKDAVKCRVFAHDAMFYLPVTAKLPEVFWQKLLAVTFSGNKNTKNPAIPTAIGNNNNAC